MLNMLINILQPTHPDDIKSWLVYAPEKGTEFFFLLKYWTSLHVLKIWCDWWFSCIIINKKKTTENSNETKFVWSFLHYAVFIWLIEGGGYFLWSPIRGGSACKMYPFQASSCIRKGTGISLVEVYQRGGKSVIWVCERAQRANRCQILWLYKVEKTFYFCDWFLFKRQCIYSS